MTGRALVLTPPGSRTGLSAARALAADGWEVHVGTPADSAFLRWSRDVAGTHAVTWPQDLDRFVADVGRVAARVRADVVLPAGDDWLAGLAAARDRLDVAVAAPPAPVVDRLLDKLALPALGEAAGLRVPTTVLADDAALAAWDGPALVKSRRHWLPGTSPSDSRLEVHRVATAEHARDRAAAIVAAGGEPVLQQVVTGRLSALSGVAHAGRVTGVVQQVALGTWPDPVGVSSRAVTITPDHDLRDRVVDLVGRLDWSGIFQAQFLVPPDETSPCSST